MMVKVIDFHQFLTYHIPCFFTMRNCGMIPYDIRNFGDENTIFRSSETEMEYQNHRGPPGVCADITQTTNLQNEANIITKKGCGKKRALPR